MKQMLAFLLFLVFTSLWFFSCELSARAQVTAPDLSTITYGGSLLPLTVGFGDTGIINGETTTLPTNSPGILSWGGGGYDIRDTALNNYMGTLGNAVYTIQVYYGEIGSSTLLYSQTVPNGFVTSSSHFEFEFPYTGHYFMTYSATYPAGVYPSGYTPDCSIDNCSESKYSLSSFESFMTNGQSEFPDAYPGFVPAYLGITAFTVQEAGPKDSNVLFIPGTMESRLYTRDYNGNEKMLWEPTSNSDIPLLAMDSNGQSKALVYTRDIIDYLYSNNATLASVVQDISKSTATLYGPFEKYMDGLVSNGTIRTWQAYPYDWRYDVSDIVANGTLVASPTSEPNRTYIQDIIQNLASTSPTGQVTIIAHSNGGLLAKALAVQLQKENKLNLIDRIILVGTPQLGTPSAIGNILHGDGQTRVLGLVTYGDTVRSTALTMPGVYDLLPSSRYFSFASAPVISFADNLSSTYQKVYGAAITTYDALQEFLTDAPNLHGVPDTGDTNTPAVLSSVLLQKAQATHDGIDGWVPPASLSIDTIVGTYQLTPQGYKYSNSPLNIVCSIPALSLIPCKNIPSLEHTPVFTELGDGMVIAESAANVTQSIYYFAANLFKTDTGQNIGHQNLLSAAPIQDEITNLLDGSTTTNPYIFPFLPSANSSDSISQYTTVISTNAPLNLVAKDIAGNESGVFPIENLQGLYLAKEEIPNSSVRTIGDKNYLDLPGAASYTISGTARSAGTGSIQIGTEDPTGAITTQNTFTDISVSASSTVSFTIGDSGVSTLAIDQDGDGTIDSIATSTSESDIEIPNGTATSTAIDSTSADMDMGTSTDTGTSTAVTVAAASTSPTIVSEAENLASDVTQVLIGGGGSVASDVSSESGGSGYISLATSTVATSTTAIPNSLFILYLQLEVKLLTLEIQFVKIFHHRPLF